MPQAFGQRTPSPGVSVDRTPCSLRQQLSTRVGPYSARALWRRESESTYRAACAGRSSSPSIASSGLAHDGSELRPATSLMLSALVTDLDASDAGTGFCALAQELGRFLAMPRPGEARALGEAGKGAIGVLPARSSAEFSLTIFSPPPGRRQQIIAGGMHALAAPRPLVPR